MRSELQRMAIELRSEMALLRKDIDHIRWMAYATFGAVLALFVRSFFT